MAISKKGKRKITVGAKKYLWWVYDEHDQGDFNGMQIEIVAESQVGYIKYGLQQDGKDRYAVICLRHQKYKMYVLCPKFEDEKGIIKPAGINRLINWCLEEMPNSENRIFVHAYNSGMGIIPEEDRLKTLEVILNEFRKE